MCRRCIVSPARCGGKWPVVAEDGVGKRVLRTKFDGAKRCLSKPHQCRDCATIRGWRNRARVSWCPLRWWGVGGEFSGISAMTWGPVAASSNHNSRATSFRPGPSPHHYLSSHVCRTRQGGISIHQEGPSSLASSSMHEGEGPDPRIGHAPKLAFKGSLDRPKTIHGRVPLAVPMCYMMHLRLTV